MIQNQIPNWSTMSPESQQRIMDAARNAGYIQNAKGKEFFMPNWMRGGKIGQMEEQLGRRIIPQAMSPDDWQKITPMASLKGDAYRQYQDFTNLIKSEQQRPSAPMPAKPTQGALGKDPSMSPQPIPRPTPGNMPRPQVQLGAPLNFNTGQPIRPVAMNNDVANRVPRPTSATPPQQYIPPQNAWITPSTQLSPEQIAALKRAGLNWTGGQSLVNALR